MKNQKEVFLDGEGDAWYSRNQISLNQIKESPELGLLSKYIQDEYKILEIGCSDGTKLNCLKSLIKTQGNSFYGIDPSNLAIEEGNNNFTDIELLVGSSDYLPYENNYFDMVIVGFCLYLVDRDLIFKTVSEIDRVLKESRILAITDFDTTSPYKNEYSHAKGVYAYKNSYYKFFEGGNHYTLADKVSFNHYSNKFEHNIDERLSTTILFKEAYREVYRENK